MTGLRSQGLPQLVWIELEYRVAVLQAEQAWVDQLATAIRNDEFEGIQDWRDWHAGREYPRWFDEHAGPPSPADHDPTTGGKEEHPDT